jgi:hypothetical protein
MRLEGTKAPALILVYMVKRIPGIGDSRCHRPVRLLAVINIASSGGIGALNGNRFGRSHRSETLSTELD